ncbi:hypothetical protein [Nostoc sp. TCL26-01]|uniref:hypothetical protein n=1 Tax=Nostoc sp. TCL26-01 TaxID=2576904 RepID=UPI0015C19C02|nr:hypothetical protein [Nostoc sp. TCL26-01]QLE58884.1 hypothetical protein FD725_27330 [Nostoc sp. TCL26-01]
MNPWCHQPLARFISGSLAIFRWLITLVLVLVLVSCGEKVVSQEVSFSHSEKPEQISQQFAEVSPPVVLQELRSSLEAYRPQVTIVTPQPDEVISDSTVSVKLQVKDLPIFQHPEWELGPHLHLFVDNQAYIPIYNLNQPLVLSDLSPGTHTLRVFASRPWHESFKNEGAYAQTTFHLFTKTDDNQPDPHLPLLTYSRPQASYGAEPILLDFYLTNAPLHLTSKDNPNSNVSDWRIRCTINGESFIFDRWQAVYLKGFKTGNNWLKLEFLDNQGNPVKNAFNTTVRVINYQPKGKDTLSRIVRGELTDDQVRGIVEPNYTPPPPVAEPTPTPTQIPEVIETTPPQLEVTPTPQPELTPTPEPEVTATPEPQPEVTATPEATESPIPEVTPTATPEPQVEVTPTTQATESSEKPVNQRKKVNLGDYFKKRSPKATPTE